MAQAQALLAGAVLAATGFAPVANSSLLSTLNRIGPTGSTAMRDSLATGISMILQLNSLLGRLGMNEFWNFLHIVITDGQDNESKTSLEDMLKLMFVVGRTIPTSRCKTIIIGIDLDADPKCRAQLIAIRQLGGENCEIYDVNSVNIGQVFDRIQVSLGIQQSVSLMGVQAGNQRALIMQRQNRPVLRVQQKRFAVLFNLDMSGSMQGARWERVKSSVHSFMANMPQGDLVGGICFNDEVHTVTK